MADTTKQATHYSDRSFTCAHCGKMYKYQNVYNKHIRQCKGPEVLTRQISAPPTYQAPTPPRPNKMADLQQQQQVQAALNAQHAQQPLTLSNSSVSQMSQQTAPVTTRASVQQQQQQHQHQQQQRVSQRQLQSHAAVARDFGKVIVNVLSNARFQNFLISLKHEQSDIGKVFVNEQQARTTFDNDAPVWKASPSAAQLLLKNGEEAPYGIGAGGGSAATAKYREDQDNRLRLVYVIDWFLGHFTKDFAQELIVIMDAGAKALMRGSKQQGHLYAPDVVQHPAEQFRANLAAKKKQLPLFFKLRPEAQTIIMDFLFNEFLEPLARFAAAAATVTATNGGN